MIVFIIKHVEFCFWRHKVNIMAPFFLFLALIIQSSLTLAQIDNHEEEITSREVLKSKLDLDDEVIKDFHGAKKDWMDMFMTPSNGLFPTSSAAMMTQATCSNKTAEEQLEDIKEMAHKITLAIQSEMATLLSYALSSCDKETEENSLRKKRSLDSPMDSTQMVMRLLKHIKANNEYQNVAIEKMMTAQEIADKFGIEFNPDPEMLSDLAVAANEQAKEMASILEDSLTRNETIEQVEFVPLDGMCPMEPVNENDTYFVYSVHQEDPQVQAFAKNVIPSYEYVPEQIPAFPVNHVHYPDHAHYSYYYPHETQIPAPVQTPAVTPKPNFYDSVMAFTPAAPEYFHPYMEPVTTTTTIILPIEETVEPEPQLVGEEYEEVVSSKVFVNHDEEPGTSTVNHVMTYTLSEKAHFKTPEIEKLPQQMQYTFFLM